MLYVEFALIRGDYAVLSRGKTAGIEKEYTAAVIVCITDMGMAVKGDITSYGFSVVDKLGKPSFNIIFVSVAGNEGESVDVFVGDWILRAVVVTVSLNGDILYMGIFFSTLERVIDSVT